MEFQAVRLRIERFVPAKYQHKVAFNMFAVGFWARHKFKSNFLGLYTAVICGAQFSFKCCAIGQRERSRSVAPHVNPKPLSLTP